MAELACNMVYVYLAGTWSWLNREAAARQRLTFRECSKAFAHWGPHMPSLTTEHPDPVVQEELDKMAGYRPPYVHDAGVESSSPRPPHPTCVETTGRAELVAGIRSWVCGRDCPRPAGPDPERDRRREAYRALEREKARRALDAWFPAVDAGDSVGERLEMARFLECVDGYRVSALHHNRHYGASQMDTGILPNAHRCADCTFTTASDDRMDGHMRATGHRHESHHKNDHGVPDDEGMGRAGGADLLDAERENRLQHERPNYGRPIVGPGDGRRD